MVPGQSTKVAAGVVGLHRQAAVEVLHAHQVGAEAAAAAAAAVVTMLQAPPHYPL